MMWHNVNTRLSKKNSVPSVEGDADYSGLKFDFLIYNISSGIIIPCRV